MGGVMFREWRGRDLSRVECAGRGSPVSHCMYAARLVTAAACWSYDLPRAGSLVSLCDHVGGRGAARRQWGVLSNRLVTQLVRPISESVRADEAVWAAAHV